MPAIETNPAVQALTTLLGESYEGVAPDGPTWYADSGPQGCLLGLLGSLNAAGAARPPGPGRKSVAQHARHIRFHLDATLRFLRGDRSGSNWDESWLVDASSDAAWQKEVAALRRSYEAVRDAAPGLLQDDWLKFASAFGTVAHAAYHMGAIRQILALTAA